MWTTLFFLRKQHGRGMCSCLLYVLQLFQLFAYIITTNIIPLLCCPSQKFFFYFPNLFTQNAKNLKKNKKKPYIHIDIVKHKHNFQQWISWLAERWRTQLDAIRNVNCTRLWIIKSLNASCAASQQHACLSDGNKPFKTKQKQKGTKFAE